MKKLFFTMVMGLGFAVVANAQTDKGTVALGGTVSYDYKKVVDSDGKSQHYSIIPSVSYFVKDNLSIGLGVGYAGSTQETGAAETTFGEFVVAPKARYYKGEGPVKFFGQLALPMGWGTNKVDGDKAYTTERYGAAIAPGIAYFPTSKLGIEFSVKGLYYDYSSQKSEASGQKMEMNEFGLNGSSFNPTIGVSFRF